MTDHADVIREALPKTHVTAEHDYASGHPALAALAALVAERDEAEGICGAMGDANVALQLRVAALETALREIMEAAERDGLAPWSVAATTVRAHCHVVAEDVRLALAALVAERDALRNDLGEMQAWERRHRNVAVARAEAAEKERDELRRSLASMEASRVDVIQQERMETAHFVARAEAAEARVTALEHAADYAIHELGVPQDELTPAPVANAYRVLVAALAAPAKEGT